MSDDVTAPVSGTDSAVTPSEWSPHDELMTRFAYYAGLVTANTLNPAADEILKSHGYDIAAVMREIEAWCLANRSKP